MASQANPLLNLSAVNFSASAAATFIPTASRALPLRAPQGQTAPSSAWLGHNLGTHGLGLPYESHPLQAIRWEMFHGRGAAMIRATVVRALVLMAAFAPTLTPVRCLGEDGNQLPTKATKELPPELLSLFRQKKMPKHSPILMRIFKEDAELEVWKQDTTGHAENVGDRTEIGPNGERHGDGGALAFLETCAITERKTFLTVMARLLPITIKTAPPIKKVLTREEALHELKERGLDPELINHLRRLPFPEEDVPALDELYPKIIDFDDEEYTGDKQPAE
jgi:hypothetical protein